MASHWRFDPRIPSGKERPADLSGPGEPFRANSGMAGLIWLRHGWAKQTLALLQRLGVPFFPTLLGFQESFWNISSRAFST